MYSSLQSVQIIISLLKEYNIKDIVISAGTRHTPLVHSLENDSFFNCYSIVDERSASFFALGMIEFLQKPVAICSTSGTAAANYISAANEAFYQQLPLLILTADRNPYYLFQQEEQMIPQENLFKDICKKAVTLPIVRDENDFWYCSRIVNEALLELEHKEKGPVHINFPIENDYPIHQGIVKFEVDSLPNIRKIERLTLEDSLDQWKAKSQQLKNSKILILYGQNGPLTKEEQVVIENFCEKYNCMISIDHLSNLHCKYSIDTYLLSKTLNIETLEELCPDIVITMNGNSITGLKGRLAKFKKKFKHWHVSKEGVVSDPLKILPDIIECSPIYFFKRFTEIGEGNLESNSYFEQWKKEWDKIYSNSNNLSDSIKYSAVYVTQQFVKNIPENSLLHIANSNSVRIANYFPIDESISVFCNRGTNGIDGSMSSFVGQSYISKKLSFLLIGDLSFFYDMNALWNKYVGNNVRILVCNNSGGAIFHNYPNTNNIPTLDQHIAAEHSTSVKEWAESRGFIYLTSNDKEEFKKVLPMFMQDISDKPIILEAFTNKKFDVTAMKELENRFRKKTIRNKVASFLPNSVKKTIRQIIK